jgi:hypothetical protein
MIKRETRLIVSLSAGVLIALGVVFATGCELLVNEDISLVDAGPTDACSLCFDGQVITLDDGNILLIPNDGGTDDDATSIDIDASDASDGASE